jgi:hypothetical protein
MGKREGRRKGVSEWRYSIRAIEEKVDEEDEEER